MQLYSSKDLRSGKRTDAPKMGMLTQPIQFLPDKEKDNDWRAWNMDWLENQGMKQLKRNSRRLLKNYKLAKGIIDKTDYIVQEENEYADLIDTLTQEDASALELKFYPIIPNVINVLTAEFSKRVSKMSFRAVDELSYNEMLEEKRGEVENVLVAGAEQKMLNKMMQMGLDPESEEAQQMMAPESLKSLPEIEGFFKKSYRNIVEEWANHQMNVDTERFRMAELEERAFRDSLTADREFWHFRMMEDDYELELWNPLLTFYHKSPGERYTSGGNYVGMIELLTIPDVIDKYGWRMTQQQFESLEQIYPVRNGGANYLDANKQNDGGFYDGTKSHKWNTEGPSLAMRQFQQAHSAIGSGDAVEWILGESEDMFDGGGKDLLRVSTIYWKTQRKIGHLTKLTEEGELIQEIVDEYYSITEKPLYDTTIYKQKTKENLIFGEHIDWMWPNETWGGVKIGPNKPATWNYTADDENCSPIYLGVNTETPGRIPFQFKGDDNLFGCKLPVEGCVYSDRNTRSVALVDLMKPFQVGYNVVNNQIADILVDELGTVILLDQNMLPKHSMGEDWGKGNLSNAFVAMKNFQMLPLDTSISNTENALNFNHFTSLNLEQTNRLMSRTNLANYFKQQAFEVIGISPERLGQQIASQTATGVEQSVNASYAQTEVYFTQHSDYLMPRVHQMRTDLAQYYNSTKPSVRLQYTTSLDEKVNFELNGTKLLLRDLNVFSTTRTNAREIVDQLKNLALNNNTTGSSIYDLGNLIKADSIAEVDRVLKSAEDKINKQRQEDQAAAQSMEEQRLAAEKEAQIRELAAQAEENEKDRQTEILVAEIRATQMNAMQDTNANSQSDQLDAMDRIHKQENYRDQSSIKREENVMKDRQHLDKVSLEREKLQTQKQISKDQLSIARENKNKYDKAQNSKSKK